MISLCQDFRSTGRGKEKKDAFEIDLKMIQFGIIPHTSSYLQFQETLALITHTQLPGCRFEQHHNTGWSYSDQDTEPCELPQVALSVPV